MEPKPYSKVTASITLYSHHDTRRLATRCIVPLSSSAQRTTLLLIVTKAVWGDGFRSGYRSSSPAMMFKLLRIETVSDNSRPRNRIGMI